MSLFNYNAKEIHCKVIYYGSQGAGKTTNIQWIQRNTTDQKLELLSIPLQTNATTFFDFLPLSAGSIRGFKLRFHLYSLPGNSLFETSQKLLLKGLDGIVFVADSENGKLQSNINSLNTLKSQLEEIGMDINKIPMAIQYNKRDLKNIHSITQMRTELNLHNHPDFSASANTGESVFETLKTLLKLIIATLKGNPF